MKKLNALLLASALAFSALLCAPAYADDGVSVEVNGEKIDFTGDQAPVIIEGRTLVPFRAVFEKMGADVKWFEDIKLCEASLGGIVCDIEIGSKTVAIGDLSTVENDVPAQIINGRTMVPLRVLSEVLGADVEWDAADKKVSITPPTVYDNEVPEELDITFADASAENSENSVSVSYSYPVISDKVPFTAREKLNKLMKSDAEQAALSLAEASNENDAMTCETSCEAGILTVKYTASSGALEDEINYVVIFGAHIDSDKLEQYNKTGKALEEAEAKSVHNYTIKEYGENKTAKDGTPYINIIVQYPEFEGEQNADINKKLEEDAKQAGRDFIEKYNADAEKYYNNPPQKLFEVPYIYACLCDVSFEGDIATVTNTYSETRYENGAEAPTEESKTETFNVDVASGKIVK